MSTTINLALTALNIGDYSDRQGVYPWSGIPTEQYLSFIDYYFAKFEAVPSQYNNKKIVSGQFCIYAKASSSYASQKIEILHAPTNWNPTTVNYNSQYTKSASAVSSAFNGDTYRWINTYLNIHELSWSFLVNGLTFQGFSQTYGTYISRDTNAPYLTVTFDDADNSLEISNVSPTGGYQAKSQACVFNWSTEKTGASIVSPTVANSKFRWKASASASATEIDCSTALTYTLPANTVSTDSFMWQCEITDSNGNTSTSDWYTISTLEVLSTATCVAPKNQALDGSVANEFSWLHEISTGTAQTKADLQYSSDNGTTWSTLATVTGSSTSKIINAGTFNSGNYLWRVRTYNTDNNAGSWSTPASFTVISAPPVPIVTCEQNPKPKVSWQSSDQQGYRVYIDDVYDSGLIFGTSNNHNIGKYLDDGTYTVKVKIQNSYGLWSEAGSAPLTVSNTAGSSMTLTVNGMINTVLSWTERLEYAYYLVYRDDICIAKIRTNQYVDRTANGTHEYFIRGIYASSKNYGISNKVTYTLVPSTTVISDLDEEVDLELKTTTSSYAEISIEESYVYNSFRVSSSNYPLVEMSKHKDKIIGFQVAYKFENEDLKTFEKMFGHTVCVKTTKGSIAVGTLLGLSKREATFYVYYECSISQSAYEEEVSI